MDTYHGLTDDTFPGSTTTPIPTLPPTLPPKPRPKGAPRPLVTSTLLLSPNILEDLIARVRGTKFRGKGHEKHDLGLLLGIYRGWSEKIVPGLTFAEFMVQVRKVGGGRGVKAKAGELRLKEFRRVLGDWVPVRERRRLERIRRKVEGKGKGRGMGRMGDGGERLVKEELMDEDVDDFSDLDGLITGGGNEGTMVVETKKEQSRSDDDKVGGMEENVQSTTRGDAEMTEGEDRKKKDQLMDEDVDDFSEIDKLIMRGSESEDEGEMDNGADGTKDNDVKASDKVSEEPTARVDVEDEDVDMAGNETPKVQTTEKKNDSPINDQEENHNGNGSTRNQESGIDATDDASGNSNNSEKVVGRNIGAEKSEIPTEDATGKTSATTEMVDVIGRVNDAVVDEASKTKNTTGLNKGSSEDDRKNNDKT